MKWSSLFLQPSPKLNPAIVTVAMTPVVGWFQVSACVQETEGAA
jgi:hypothetical protein